MPFFNTKLLERSSKQIRCFHVSAQSGSEVKQSSYNVCHVSAQGRYNECHDSGQSSWEVAQYSYDLFHDSTQNSWDKALNSYVMCHV